MGPVGHTFDTQSDDPLFVSSSFIIRPPEIKDCSDHGDFGWYFIKLKFRRSLPGKYVEPVPGAKTDAAPLDIVSEILMHIGHSTYLVSHAGSKPVAEMPMLAT